MWMFFALSHWLNRLSSLKTGHRLPGIYCYKKCITFTGDDPFAVLLYRRNVHLQIVYRYIGQQRFIVSLQPVMAVRAFPSSMLP